MLQKGSVETMIVTPQKDDGTGNMAKSYALEIFTFLHFLKKVKKLKSQNSTLFCQKSPDAFLRDPQFPTTDAMFLLKT